MKDAVGWCQALDSVEGHCRMFVSCVGQLKWKTWLVDMMVGVMSMFSLAIPILVNGLNQSTAA